LEKQKEVKKSESLNQSNFHQKKDFDKQQKRLRKVIEKLESGLEKKMNRKEEIEEEMSKPDFFTSQLHETVLIEHQEILNKISQLENEWEEAMLELESMEEPEI